MIMKREEKMSFAEEIILMKMEEMEKQAKKREKMKREAKVTTTIRTASGSLANRYAEFLRQNNIFHDIECVDGVHIIRIIRLSNSETSKLMRKMNDSLGLTAKKVMTGKDAA